MKKLTLVFVALCSFQLLIAQTTITKDIVQSYLQDEISRISTLLIKAGLDSKIPVYVNDSLAATYTVTELAGRAVDTVYKPMYVEDTITIAASIEYKTTHLKGLEFGFSGSSDFDRGTYSNQISFVAPLMDVSVSGINLGVGAIGLFKLNDIEYVLDKHDFAFIKGLALQSQVRGNMQTYAVQFYDEPDSTDAEYVVWRSVCNEYTYTRFDGNFSGRYNHHLLSGFVAFNKDRNLTFYRDAQLSLPYNSLDQNLAASDTAIMLVDGDYVAQEVSVIPVFSGPFDFKIHHTTNDRIVEILYTDFQSKQSIFFSWNEVAESFKPYDRAVLKHMISVMH